MFFSRLPAMPRGEGVRGWGDVYHRARAAGIESAMGGAGPPLAGGGRDLGGAATRAGCAPGTGWTRRIGAGVESSDAGVRRAPSRDPPPDGRNPRGIGP